MQLFFHVEGMAELSRKLGELNALGRRYLTPVVAKYALKIQAMARRLCPVDTGLLRASILTKYFDVKLTAEVGSDKEYAFDVENGTRPHFVPSDKLAGWAKRHGLEPGAEFYVARQIAKHGTRAQPFLGPAYEEHAPAFVAEAEQVLSSGIGRLVQGG